MQSDSERRDVLSTQTGISGADLIVIDVLSYVKRSVLPHTPNGQTTAKPVIGLTEIPAACKLCFPPPPQVFVVVVVVMKTSPSSLKTPQALLREEKEAELVFPPLQRFKYTYPVIKKKK